MDNTGSHPYFAVKSESAEFFTILGFFIVGTSFLLSVCDIDVFNVYFALFNISLYLIAIISLILCISCIYTLWKYREEEQYPRYSRGRVIVMCIAWFLCFAMFVVAGILTSVKNRSFKNALGESCGIEVPNN